MSSESEVSRKKSGVCLVQVLLDGTWLTPNEFQTVSGRGAAKDWKRTVKHAGVCIKALLAARLLSIDTEPGGCVCKHCTSTDLTVSILARPHRRSLSLSLSQSSSSLPSVIGPIPWGHSGPLCHALSLSSLWTSHAACAIAIAGMRLATPGD